MLHVGEDNAQAQDIDMCDSEQTQINPPSGECGHSQRRGTQSTKGQQWQPTEKVKTEHTNNKVRGNSREPTEKRKVIASQSADNPSDEIANSRPPDNVVSEALTQGSPKQSDEITAGRAELQHTTATTTDELMSSPTQREPTPGTDEANSSQRVENNTSVDVQSRGAVVPNRWAKYPTTFHQWRSSTVGREQPRTSDGKSSRRQRSMFTGQQSH